MGLEIPIVGAVFLDRDGVINRAKVVDGKPVPPDTLEDLEILPGVAETIAKLKAAALRIIVVANQPDVATGRQSRATVEAFHRHLLETLDIDDIRACFCVEGPDCHCYKPKPGLLLEAARDWGIDLSASFMVGDRWRDIGAGKAAGCLTFFIDYGYREQPAPAPDFVVADLAQAGRIILENVKHPEERTSL